MDPNASLVSRLFGSRKFMLMLVALVGVFTLAALGRLPIADAISFLKVVLPVWLAAQGAEDAMVKSAALKGAPQEEGTK
jgi:hypothetical protein